MRLIDADVLLEKVREIRKLALDRAVETPANMPFPIYQNPAYTRYSTQADEREKFKVMIEEAPSVQPEHMHTVMLKIAEKYEKAMNTSCILNPMAWALYQTWKEYDR